MPWVCGACQTEVPRDDLGGCPSCGAPKEAWSVVDQMTRTLVVSPICANTDDCGPSCRRRSTVGPSRTVGSFRWAAIPFRKRFSIPAKRM